MRSENDLVCEMEVKLEFDSDAMTWCFSTFFVCEREREKLGSNFFIVLETASSCNCQERR